MFLHVHVHHRYRKIPFVTDVQTVKMFEQITSNSLLKWYLKMTMQFVSQKERERVVVQYLTSICNDGRCKSGKSQVHLSCEKNREKFLIVINIIMNNNNNNR